MFRRGGAKSIQSVSDTVARASCRSALARQTAGGPVSDADAQGPLPASTLAVEDGSPGGLLDGGDDVGYDGIGDSVS